MCMADEVEVRAVLTGEMRFAIDTDSGHKIVVDSEEENAGARPMELLLVALAGCSGMDIITILRKKRQDITSYELKIHGSRAQEHPKVYKQITVEHILSGHNIQPAAVQRAIQLSEEKYCGVGNILDKTAIITHTFTIKEL
ncbi:MAG: OsmC family protein [Ktedonobacteraceae bacterium]